MRRETAEAGAAVPGARRGRPLRLGMAAALALAGVGAASAQPAELTVGMAFSSRLPALGSPAAWVSERLETLTDGSLTLALQEPGETLPPRGLLPAVSAGELDAAYTWPGYDRQHLPAAVLFSAVPFGMKPWAFQAWYRFRGGEALMQAVYAGAGYAVHLELCGLVSPETAGWFRGPVESLQAFEGLDIRFAGLGGDVLARLGADVHRLPDFAINEALQDGVIDATEFSIPVVDQRLGLDQLLKFNLLPGWHQPSSAQYLMVNRARWQGLTERQRGLIRLACQAATGRALAEAESANAESLRQQQAYGVRIASIPERVLHQLADVAQTVIREQAEADEAFARVWAAQREFMADYVPWDNRAHVPASVYERLYLEPD